MSKYLFLMLCVVGCAHAPASQPVVIERPIDEGFNRFDRPPTKEEVEENRRADREQREARARAQGLRTNPVPHTGTVDKEAQRKQADEALKKIHKDAQRKSQ